MKFTLPLPFALCDFIFITVVDPTLRSNELASRRLKVVPSIDWLIYIYVYDTICSYYKVFAKVLLTGLTRADGNASPVECATL